MWERVVPNPCQTDMRNHLLRVMSVEDFAHLAPNLNFGSTHLGEYLIVANQEIEKCFFPEVGFASVVANQTGKELEVGLIGNEGLVGAVPVVLDDDRTPHSTYVQGAGSMYSVATPVLLDAIERSPRLRRLLLRYVQTHLVQVSQTAFAQATLGLEGRMARWLLMCHDRSEGDEILLTHEFLSVMLGVQRAGVTLTLQNLEGSGSIKCRRKRIQVLDRDRLVELTGGIYGVPEREYQRLIGIP